MPPLDTPRYLASAKNATASATSSGRIDSTRTRTQANVDSIQLLCIDLIYIIIQHSLAISLIWPSRRGCSSIIGFAAIVLTPFEAALRARASTYKGVTISNKGRSVRVKDTTLPRSFIVRVNSAFCYRQDPVEVRASPSIDLYFFHFFFKTKSRLLLRGCWVAGVTSAGCTP